MEPAGGRLSCVFLDTYNDISIILQPFLWIKIGRTSFCVVSLVARTARGRAAIRAAGWESARDPSTSAFLPQDPTVLFQVL